MSNKPQDIVIADDDVKPLEFSEETRKMIAEWYEKFKQKRSTVDKNGKTRE